jgi:ribonucleoside-diphosphate reductase alpha chain
MLSIDADSPEAADFITAKQDLTKITGANISVRVKDHNMESRIINKIATAAHKTAEPGILFWDTILRESPADCYKEEGFETVSSNPCGEIPLSAYDACRLLAINMYSYVLNPFTEDAKFDYGRFVEDVMAGQRLLDDIVDLEVEKINKILNKIKTDPEALESKIIEYNLWKKIKEATLKGRRTGLGATGIADMFAALNIEYGNPDKFFLIEDIFSEFAAASYVSSIILAKERGSFPVFNRLKESNNPFISRVLNSIKNSSFHSEEDYVGMYFKYGRRNIANLTIAPTGSISILAKVSNGVENVFEISYLRRRKTSKEGTFVDKTGDSWITFRVFHDKFKVWMKNYLNMNDEALELHIAKLSDADVDELYKASPYANTIVKDINPINKVKLQGLIQQYIDHAISNTCNLPETATVSDIVNVIKEAHQSGCKGLTVYRQGSRDGVLIKSEETSFPNERPREIFAIAERVSIEGRDTFVVIGMHNKTPYEVFIIDANAVQFDLTKAASLVIVKRDSKIYDLNIRYETASGFTRVSVIDNILSHTIIDNGKFSTRLISLLLRNNVDINELVTQIDKSDDPITNVNKVIARILKKHFNAQNLDKVKCPDCGEEMHNEGGCSVCYNCGYSKCN